MKRLLPSIPIFFLLLLNACGNGISTPIPDDVGTRVAQTQTATVAIPSPTQTPNPDVPNMISTLNVDLSIINPLEELLDAEYQVMDISFETVGGYPDQVFLINVRCKCSSDNDCCHPQRTFVVIMNAMKRNYNFILAHVPGGISHLVVVCSDHKTPIGAISASWPATRDYLSGISTAYQFEKHVNLTEAP